MKNLMDVLREGKVLLSDGAWGTALYERGLKAGECPELWCLTHFDEVSAIAKGYVNAGANLVETNSFGANRLKLEAYGLADKAVEINKAAAKASRLAAGENVWVWGSMGPTGKLLLMGDVTEDELYEAYAEQAKALFEGGADALCIETMSDGEEALIAVKAAKENTPLPVAVTFAFEKTVQGEYRTMMGLAPVQMAEMMTEADIIGANCGNGLSGMIDITREIRTVSDKPILIHANAGMPKNIDGKDVFPETPSDMAAQIPALIKAGANIIGGCCGTTPAHIKAMGEALHTL